MNLRTSELQDKRDQEEQVRRVAYVHDVERPPPVEIEGQPLHLPERRRVLPDVGANAAGCEAKRKSMDANTLELNVGLEVAALPLQAADIDIVSRACKRSSLASDAAIERYREVLDEHEDACRVVSARE